MKIKVDTSAKTHLPICACGWRGLPGLSHSDALNQARRHEIRAHPGHHDAHHALNSYKYRHAKSV